MSLSSEARPASGKEKSGKSIVRPPSKGERVSSGKMSASKKRKIKRMTSPDKDQNLDAGGTRRYYERGAGSGDWKG
jgi:hypothetical protein